jgi:type I restriction enzyme R subunit
MMIFINGIPVISFELKNELTKQNVQHAIKQYKEARDPNEELFRLGRLMVNFAVDTEEIWMCTQLKKEKSYFLPFNKGFNNGAGNPPNGGIKTDYLWKEVLTKSSLTNIIQNFCQLITEEKEYLEPSTSSGQAGKVKTRKEKKLIFPRYHQLLAVRNLLADAQENGSGQKYLIQHSAGSGKSNSISWLAHQLVGLHDKSGKNNIFDTVIVVTDRRVLDAQIRNNIKQFQQVNGVVEAITEGSKQLKEALEEGKKIIITTIQKFPHIVEEIGDLPGTNFAIIIDEAHSSLSGQMARKLNESLAVKTGHAPSPDDDEMVTEDNDTITGEDLITDLIKSRKLLPNASYFAFTATPKNKTLELFGVPFHKDSQTQGIASFRAFHLYSMKQAIEEGFIMDVLQNYTTYQSYYALLKKIEDDPEYDKLKAQKKLKHFVESHEHAIKKKAVLIVEHFMENVIRKKRMGGLAKAMLVTSSRKNAVKYKNAFDDYLHKINSPYKAIVAFSGEIDGQTEASLNGFSSASIPKEFEKNEYRFLLVANKFQTGFDQPLLHTMYVDKKLGGVNAVQTLSRLNRSHPLKKDTFVLDFANTAEDIEKAFKPYFESTILGEATDPNKLFDLQDALDNYQVYTKEQVVEFSNKILANVPVDQLHAILDNSTAIFRNDLEEEQQADFRAKVKTYVRLYIFLSQIVPFENPYLERLYIFLNHLQNKLGGDTPIDLAQGILDNIDMDSYRLQLEATVDIALEQGEDLKPMPTEMRGSTNQPEIDKLSNILQTFNDRYGTQFEDVDKVRQMAESVANDVAKNQELITSIKYSDDQNARITSDKIVGEELLKHITTNFDLYKLYSDNKEFKEDFSAMMFSMVKEIFNRGISAR